MTIAEFLLARIDEDEAAVGAIDFPSWPTATKVEREDELVDTVSMHSKRMLAECEAKRRIVVEGGSRCSAYGDPLNAEIADSIGMPEWLHYPDPNWTGHCDGCSSAEAADDVHRRIIMMMTAVYADHPDYDESWRP